MAERLQLTKPKPGGGLYFKVAHKAKNSVEFIDSGCALLNCLCSYGPRGSWPLGRVVNIIGDTSVGKTLLAIEGAHNFAKAYPKGLIAYRESEGGFDLPYAESIGFPVERVDFGPDGPETKWDTVEDIFEDLTKFLAKAKAKKQPGLYVIDSLDGLGSRLDQKAAQKARKQNSDAGSYKMGKQKTMSEMLGELTKYIRAARVCVIFISQVRENIGITYGKKYRRSGGKALDFYARLILWLAHIEFEYKTHKGLKQATAVRIRVKCTKNHVGGRAPRECEFSIRFGFGIDDVNASLDWLYHVGRLSKLGMTEPELNAIERLTDEDYAKVAAKVREVTYAAWEEVEAAFEPTRRKYI